MASYASRIRVVDDRWQWTVADGGWARPAPPCDLECPGHGEREEADLHFWLWLLEHMLVLTHQSEFWPCHVCEMPTPARWLSLWGLLAPTPLCEAHSTVASRLAIWPVPGRVAMETR